MIGRPCVFLRLAGCDLRCKWCDTKYSWENGETYSIREVVNILNKEGLSQLGYLVITGGEPLLQISDINSLLDLYPKELRIGLETNGTHFYTFPGENVDYVVSPKLSNSGNTPEKARVLDGWFEGAQRGHPVYFKFVVGLPKIAGDLVEVEKYIEEHEIPKENIWIMPQCTTREEQLRLMPFLWEFCSLYGYNFSPRLQILTFGKKRGV